MAATQAEDVFSIMLTTDNHVGYAEKDPVRGQDSVNTLEEVLQLAQQHDVDFILQGGDLFHDNKPSRAVLHRTMQLLRQYCMGDRPVGFRVLSDQTTNFQHCSFQQVNYEDPNYNIGIPVFMIHGNHDDPVGDGNLSAVDILSVANMVNYFGKASSVEEIVVSPVLLQKGTTKIALYGLGSVRDERLHRTWKNEKVNFLRPTESPTEWFNILVLHQNRARHGLRNFIPEEFIPPWFDLVMWGHEHECRVTEEYRQFGVDDENGFYITQPGSSIATSLVDGEAKLKHVAVLQVKGVDFKVQALKLESVRPFLLDTVTLSDGGLQPDDKDEVERFLEHEVQQLIDRKAVEHPTSTLLPLVRLKVDYSGGFEPINVQRFGQRFIEQVANPKNILMFFHKRIESGPKPAKEATDGSAPFGDSFRTKNKDNVNILKFLTENLEKEALQLLSTRNLVGAVREYVDKGERQAVTEVVNRSMKAAQQSLKEKPVGDVSEDIAAEIDKRREELRERQEEEGERAIQQLAERRSKNPRARTANSDSEGSLSESEGEGEGTVPARGKSTTGRGRGRGRGTSTASSSRGQSSESTSGRGRGRGRSRGNRSTASSSILQFTEGPSSSTTSSSSAAGASGVKRVTNKRGVINYEDPGDGTDSMWVAGGSKRRKDSQSSCLPSQTVTQIDLTQDDEDGGKPEARGRSPDSSNPFTFTTRRSRARK